MTLTVNGTDYEVMPRDENESIGTLAHFVLWRERYAWTEIDLRDAEGHSLLPGTRPANARWPVYVGRPIGHGG